jgi:hypothetical protein
MTFDEAMAAASLLHKYNPNHEPAGTSQGGEFASGGGAGGAAVAAATGLGGEPALDARVTDVGGDEWNKNAAVRMERQFQGVKPDLEKLTARLTAPADFSKDPKGFGDLTAPQKAAVRINYIARNITDFQYQMNADWQRGPGKAVAIADLVKNPRMQTLQGVVPGAEFQIDDWKMRALTAARGGGTGMSSGGANMLTVTNGNNIQLADYKTLGSALSVDTSGNITLDPNAYPGMDPHDRIALASAAKIAFDHAAAENVFNMKVPDFTDAAELKAGVHFDAFSDDMKFAQVDQRFPEFFPSKETLHVDMPEHVEPIGDAVGDSDGKATDWDGLTGDAQTKAEEAYLENNLQQEVDYQENQWRENQAPEDAATDIADNETGGDKGRQWLRDAIQEHFDDREEDGEKKIPFTVEQLDDAITLNTSGDRLDKHSGVEFGGSSLDSPEGFDPDPNFVGVEPEKPQDRLTQEMREGLDTKIRDAFAIERDKRAGNMDPPDYLADAAKSSIQESWDSTDDDDKYKFAQNNLSDEYLTSSSGDSEDGSVDSEDYSRTHDLAEALSQSRTKELMRARGIKKIALSGSASDDEPTMQDIKNTDEKVWGGWKESSSGTNGRILQVAAAEEMGGRLNVAHFDTDDLNSIKSDANSIFANVGGYDGVKAYVRAKWETTQYLLAKADKPVVQVYRGVMLSGKDIAATPKVRVDGFTKLPEINVMRNGAMSTTATRSVANGWGGVGFHPDNETRVVLRASVPRTAILSVPVYGQNVQSEREIVVMGTAWQKWDAWKDAAPDFKSSPITKADGGVWESGGKLNIDVLEMEMAHKLPHWLSKPPPSPTPAMDFATALAAVRKFNPDEERDDHGRWAGGGTFYHGTAKAALAAIKKEGLIPHKGEGADKWGIERGMPRETMMAGDRKMSVYMSPYPDVAARFAEYAAEQTGTKPVLLRVTLPPEESPNVKPDERFEPNPFTGENPAWRHIGPIKPEWIKPLSAKEAEKLLFGKVGPPLTFYIVIPVDGHIEKFDPDQPRDEDGKWTGMAFASASIHDKDFGGAVHDLSGPRQKVFEAMSRDIDNRLGLVSQQAGVIGAWSDGAENATLTESDTASPAALRLATVMKGHLANQKAVLVFNKAQDGPHALYDLTVPGQPAETHAALLKAGIGFHTLVPSTSGTRVLVVDTDGSLGHAVGDFAAAHNVDATRTAGHAEFIGDHEGTGTDADQRARGRAAYEAAIASDPSQYQGRSAGDLWRGIRDRWASQLEAQKRALTFGEALGAVAKFNPSHDEHGRFSSTDPDMTKSITFDGALAAVRKLAVPDSLYVHRPLANAERLHAWASRAGIPNLVPPHEMHVTQVYSRKPVALEPNDDTVSAVGGRRGIMGLGDKGAVVLHFHSDDLQARHKEAMAAGASHDWPQYLTHVTLSYDSGGKDLTGTTPPAFPLVFGPEVHAPINDGWAEEKGLRKMLARAFAKQFAKYSETEPRDEDGRWTGGGNNAGSSESWGDGAHQGPTYLESLDEDDAYERMADHLNNPGNKGVGPLDSRNVKDIWIKNSPLHSIEQVYAGAEANKATLDETASKIADETGTQWRAAGVKEMPRVLVKDFHATLRKMAAGRAPAGVTDIVRGTFAVDTLEQANAVAKALAEKFPATDEGYKMKAEGYFDRAVNVQFKNGQIGEVLIAPPALIEAKSPKGGGGHNLYKEWRSLDPKTPRAAELFAAQQAVYRPAYDSLSAGWKAAVGNFPAPAAAA